MISQRVGGWLERRGINLKLCVGGLGWCWWLGLARPHVMGGSSLVRDDIIRLSIRLGEIALRGRRVDGIKADRVFWLLALSRRPLLLPRGESYILIKK